MMIHTNEKPFTCSYGNCLKSFREKGNLNIHLKKHKQEVEKQTVLTNDSITTNMNDIFQKYYDNDNEIKDNYINNCFNLADLSVKAAFPQANAMIMNNYINSNINYLFEINDYHNVNYNNNNNIINNNNDNVHHIFNIQS